jgi:poly [ADP-ribose] polymerase 2/3/4
MGKVVKLIMITPENNNKFYHMTENTNGTFTAEWGRVGASGQSQSKSMSQWDKVYREKVGKGYKDNTELFIVEGTTENKSNTTKSIKDFLKSRTTAVIDIVKKLQGWAKGSIEENYTVTSENVTQKQVDKAQSILNEITQYDLKTGNINKFNEILIEFYGIVPRKMKKVAEHLVKADDDLKERKNKIITEEQATLDVMAGQVLLNTNIKETVEEEAIVETDIIQASGLEITEVTDSKIISKIKDLMGPNKSQFKAAFEFKNVNTHLKYDKHVGAAKNKKEELFWHGSRNENWWSIVTTGLLIRPSNAVATGSMFGDGIYFADKFQKSYGYSSGRNSYFAKGNSNLAILALYSVHVGEQKNIKKHDSSCYSLNWNRIQKEGFDSVFAHGGADLRNNEYIVYQSQQNTIKYLVVVDA